LNAQVGHVAIKLWHVNSNTNIDLWTNFCNAAGTFGISATNPFRLYDSANRTAVAGTACGSGTMYYQPLNKMVAFL